MSAPVTEIPDVAALLGPGPVVRECATDADLVDLLFPEEREVVAKAVGKRRAEFAAGRLAARAALREFGIPECPLLPGPNRAPVWPDGIVGTISHTRTRALVAVGPATAFRGLGVDLEPDEPVKEDLWARILTPGESGGLNGPDRERGRQVRRLFTAKEAVYKALHPATGVFLGFQDVAVRVVDDGSFQARVLRPDLPEEFPGRELRGRWVRTGDDVVSGLALRV